MNKQFTQKIFDKPPIFLAPLAGVSDHPFRRLCQRAGADLTYVEMLSATALSYSSKRTLDMLYRHVEEERLGVQITSRNEEELGKAIALLDTYSFESIDINMGCPVRKVVQAGCGSAIIKDPEKVYRYVKVATENTSKPISAKIRIGWDHESLNYLQVAEAVEKGGASWLTVHGRTRNDDYSCPVNLVAIKQIKDTVSIPVIGNGNIFSKADMVQMTDLTGIDGVMISRGALGNPWIFRQAKNAEPFQPDINEWHQWLFDHLQYQEENFGTAQERSGVICMRKHLLWYLKGWPGSRMVRDVVNHTEKMDEVKKVIDDFVAHLKEIGVTKRHQMVDEQETKDVSENKFLWDPKYEMNRDLDRGIWENSDNG